MRPVVSEGSDRTSLEEGRRQGTRWRFTAPAVLLLLLDGSAHGYDLLARLGGAFPRAGGLPDSGSFYRVLRALEREGAVTSSWDTAKAGPAKRVYAITPKGRERLDAWSLAVEHDMRAMRRFLTGYRKATGSRPHSTTKA
jgi:PadR family transcriptional regulator, regulatory protein PadR